MSQKFDLELKHEEVLQNWRQNEIKVLIMFLNQLCENCFKPAQIFIRRQSTEDVEFNLQTKKAAVTSINLIYEVVTAFIDTVDILGDYVFSDFRTCKLVPLLIDTLIEFMYGPCIENQIFLGKWKKLISVINRLISREDFGNYSGIHHEAKAQLDILFSCS